MKTQTVQSINPMNAQAKSWRSSLTILAATVVAVLLLLLLAAPASADDDDDDGGEYLARQIVVKLAPGTNIGYINRKYDTTTVSKLPGEQIYLLRIPRGADPASLANRIERNEKPLRVVYAEPNFKTGLPEASRQHNARPGGAPNPSGTAEQYRTQYALNTLNLTEAHAVNRGAGSVIAVVDTGVQANHPELSGRLTQARYDFVDGDRNPADLGNNRDDDRDGVKDEMVGHGTHVAGVAALAAPDAQIMPVRALDSEGRGTTFGVARAATYAVNNGADVVNLSLGSSRETELLEDLIGDDDDDDDESSGRDAVFVAAAGNDRNSVPQYPAAEDGAIAVTAVNANEKKAGFANYGGWITVAAPGSGIYSPFPISRFASWSGTSMATPFVAGQAALIRSLQPSANAECVSDIIGSTARSLSTSDPTYGDQLGSGHADIGASTRYASNQANLCAGDDD